MWDDFFFKVQRSATNSGVTPSLWPPGTLPRRQTEVVVAGDFIGRRPEFLIAGDSEKRKLFNVVKGGKERKRRGERKKKKRRKGGKGKGKKERQKKDLGSKSINRDDESSVAEGVGRFFFQSPGGLPKTR